MSARANPSGQHMPATPFDILAEELGAVAGRVERETALRIEALVADMRRIDAERELRYSQLERRVEDAIGRVKDGAPGLNGEVGQPGPAGADADMALVRTMIDEAVAAAVAAIPLAENGKDADPALVAELVAAEVAKLPSPADGKDADLEVIAALVAAEVAKIPAPANGKDVDPEFVIELVAAEVAKIPAPAAGKDADPAVIRQMVQEAVAEIPPAEAGPAGVPGPAGQPGERGERGPAGRLPIVKVWEDRVYYEGEAVVHAGATFQALRDTGRDPSHEDWQCIAAAGRDGKDGLSFTIRGTFAADADYAALDVVALNGASFVARRDNPGACPGNGWQMIAAQGKRGNPGEPGRAGPKGDRGAPGVPLVAASVDDDGLLVLTNGDGTVSECDLYPLLTKLAR